MGEDRPGRRQSDSLGPVCRGRRGLSARSAREESAALHKRTGHTAGNGSLMRTASVALAYLDDEAALVEAAAPSVS